MAQCISPYYHKENKMSFPCGKCLPCKTRRVSGWSFRLLKEADRSDSALFVTLTYNTDHVPITNKGYMSLNKRDLQLFFKRLRTETDRSTKNTIWDKKIKYYAVGEYGGKSKRPHYHIILYNAEYHNIEAAWKKGSIHYGQLTPASCAYTLKYISKDSTIPEHANDDRLPEFSLMSKRLGDNYLTQKMIAWHKALGFASIDRFYCTTATGIKLAMPRYYKKKIFDPIELQLIGNKFSTKATEDYQKLLPEQKLDFDKKFDQYCHYNAHHNHESRTTTI